MLDIDQKHCAPITEALMANVYPHGAMMMRHGSVLHNLLAVRGGW
jgi:hypothetical protein